MFCCLGLYYFFSNIQLSIEDNISIDLQLNFENVLYGKLVIKTLINEYCKFKLFPLAPEHSTYS